MKAVPMNDRIWIPNNQEQLSTWIGYIADFGDWELDEREKKQIITAFLLNIPYAPYEHRGFYAERIYLESLMSKLFPSATDYFSQNIVQHMFDTAEEYLGANEEDKSIPIYFEEGEKTNTDLAFRVCYLEDELERLTQVVVELQKQLSAK